ncbi:MAG: hypothetical protein RMJ14_03350 [Nitrososphaerota archaeon]|nr:hypothetical protein [Aigarchaeota archaeon]MDW8076656.1 hypothetical protein [Nitrososphaerota archaeon]
MVSRTKSKFVLTAILIVGIIISLSLTLLYVGKVFPPTTTTLPINPSKLNFEFNIHEGKGTKDFGEIAIIDVGKPDMLKFKLVDWSVEGLQSLSLSIRGDLVSKNANYSIYMPCVLYFNTSCARVTVIIPGYDVLLRIEPGRYSLRLEAYWTEAKDSGRVRLSISTKAYNAAIIHLGYESPQDTSYWITAEGSTRSYAMLVDKVETSAGDSGYGEFTTYIWVFAPLQEENKIFKFNIISLETGKVEHHLEIPVEKKNSTYSSMLLIKATPGKYRLSVLQPVKLSVDLTVK